MTKDKALDLALEGAANYIDALGGDSRKYRQALANAALDRMAENARELGLDYEPAEVLGHNGWGFPIKAAAPVQEDWGPGPHEYHSLTAPVQEPVAWRYRGILHDFDPSDWAEGPVTPLYTTPPAQPAPVQEPVGQNICIECANADSWGLPDKPACRSCVSNSEWEPLNVSSKNPATPPAAQRPVAKPHKWVGLDGDDQIKEMWLQMNPQSLVNFARAIEAKLKEKNSD